MKEHLDLLVPERGCWNGTPRVSASLGKKPDTFQPM